VFGVLVLQLQVLLQQLICSLGTERIAVEQKSLVGLMIENDTLQ
jgi:hypothetical protein